MWKIPYGLCYSILGAAVFVSLLEKSRADFTVFSEGTGGRTDRDRLELRHFRQQMVFCKQCGLGCDLDPTFFSAPSVIRRASERVALFDDETKKAAIEIVRCGVPEDGAWFSEVQRYEREVLSKR